MTAIGHAHIDSAWLWPLRETRRKVVRTFSNVVALAQEYPDFHFACTSASTMPGSKNPHQSFSNAFRRPSSVASGTRWAVCGWSPTLTCPPGSRW